MSNYPPGVTGNEYAIAGGTAIRGTARMNVIHGCNPEKFDDEFAGTVDIDDIEIHAGEFSGFYDCPQCGALGNLITWDED